MGCLGLGFFFGSVRSFVGEIKIRLGCLCFRFVLYFLIVYFGLGL